MASGPFPDEPLPGGTRFACRIAYTGAGYSGWQSQPGDEVATVQDTLEHALGVIANAPVRVHCAGRTDTGVHAHCQVIHFEAPVSRSIKSWVIGTNANLPRDIRVHWAHPVADTFHARFSALARRYRYIIGNTRIRSAILLDHVTWHARPLAEHRMRRAAACLEGEQDFSAFRAAACQSETPMRNIHAVDVWRRGDFVVIDIAANAFLHHMVRNIAGALLAVGDGREPVDWLAALLAGRDRTVAADTAPAAGLYLVDVDYPAEYGLPPTPYGPDFLAPGP